jgi:imidazolonepropionase
MNLMPEEALNAVTINGAFAMEVNDVAGSITVGKKANFIITKEIPSLYYLPYAFGSNSVDKVFLNGREV